MNKSRIFILNIPNRGGMPVDISDAGRFGEIQEPIFTRQACMEENADSITKTITEYFKAENITEDDYILQVGEHTLFTTGCLIASTFVDKINILKWNRNIINGVRSGGGYTEISIDVYN